MIPGRNGQEKRKEVTYYRTKAIARFWPREEIDRKSHKLGETQLNLFRGKNRE